MHLQWPNVYQNLTIMRYPLYILFTVLFTASFLACGEPVSGEAPRANPEPETATALMINFTSDPMADPHSGLMGLHLAQKALQGGRQVTVFLNVHGVKLLSPEADTLVFREENLKEVMTAFMRDGGAVRACPHCMEAHEITADNFPEGVRVMEDGEMMSLLESGPTVFTY